MKIKEFRAVGLFLAAFVLINPIFSQSESAAGVGVEPVDEAEPPEVAEESPDVANGDGDFDSPDLTLPSIVTYLPANPAQKEIKITAEEISQNHYEDLTSVLNACGIQNLSYGPYGLESKPSIRGYTDETVRVVIDGLCMNNAQYGTFDFSTINLDSVEEIKVVRGGFTEGVEDEGAVGGVIYITTKKEGLKSNFSSDTRLKTYFNSDHLIDLMSQNLAWSGPLGESSFANVGLSLTNSANSYYFSMPGMEGLKPGLFGRNLRTGLQSGILYGGFGGNPAVRENAEVTDGQVNATFTHYYGGGNYFSFSDFLYSGKKETPGSVTISGGKPYATNQGFQEDWNNHFSVSLYNPAVGGIVNLKNTAAWTMTNRTYREYGRPGEDADGFDKAAVATSGTVSAEPGTATAAATYSMGAAEDGAIGAALSGTAAAATATAAATVSDIGETATNPQSIHKINSIKYFSTADFFAHPRLRENLGLSLELTHLDSTADGNHNQFSGVLKSTTKYAFNSIFSASLPLAVKFCGKNFAFVPKAGIGADFGSLGLSLSAYRMVQFPNLDDLYWEGDGFHGNPNLKPESGWGADFSLSFDDLFAGSGGVGSGFSGFVTIFTNYYKDKIQWSSGRTQNLASAFYLGLDFSLQKSFFGEILTLKVDGEYLYTRLLDKSNKYTYGKRIMWTPDMSATFSAIIKSKITMINMQTQYVGLRYTSNMNINQPGYYLPPYILINLSADFKVSSHVTPYLRLDNLTNTQYQSVEGYPMPGISLTLGFKCFF